MPITIYAYDGIHIIYRVNFVQSEHTTFCNYHIYLPAWLQKIIMLIFQNKYMLVVCCDVRSVKQKNQLLTIENFLRLVKTIRQYCKLLV